MYSGICNIHIDNKHMNIFIYNHHIGNNHINGDIEWNISPQAIVINIYNHQSIKPTRMVIYHRDIPWVTSCYGPIIMFCFGDMEMSEAIGGTL